MAIRSRRIRRRSAGALSALLLAAVPAAPHVLLLAPNGGEVLESGEVAVIEWEVAVGHSTEGWDLWYSTTGEEGPWIVITAGLPPGDTMTGAIHTFDWTVPEESSTEVRVRVRQDNLGDDYDDVSDGDLAIMSDAIFADGFETGDADAW